MTDPEDGADSLFNRYLHAPLESLITPDQQSSKPSPSIESWNLPDRDKQALESWGLPIIDAGLSFAQISLWGDVQDTAAPEFDAHGSRGYRLGRFWQWTIVAADGVGVVLGVQQEPDVRTAFINSDVASFVEISWRWHFVRRLLVELDADGAPDDQVFAYTDRFCERVQSIDAALEDEQRFAWWSGIIRS